MWLTLAAALALVNIYVYQLVMLPQPRDYHGLWYGARWIAVANSSSPVAYFRKDFALESVPNNAFLTIQANQNFSVYVDGALLDSAIQDYSSSALYNTHVYDIAALLQTGANTVSVRADNLDVGAAQIRAVIGLNYGAFQQIMPSDLTWKATANALLTQPYLAPTSPNWQFQTFDDSAWQSASLIWSSPQPDGVVPFDPVVFQTPMPMSWITAGPHPGAFFFQHVTLPTYREVWLRVASTGTSTVYLNGSAALTQPVRLPSDQTGADPPSQAQYTAGVYNITPYIHSGNNTIAAHVASAGINLETGAQTQPAAMTLDILAITPDGSAVQMMADSSWLASSSNVAGWVTGHGSANWASAIPISQTVITTTPVYKIALPATQATAGAGSIPYPSSDQQQISFLKAALVLLLTTFLILLIGCAGAAILYQRFKRSGAKDTYVSAVRGVAFAFAPGAALLGLCLVVGRQPLVPRPFPFNWWVIALFAAVTFVTFGVIAVFWKASRVGATDVGATEVGARSPAPGAWYRSPATVATATAALIMAGIGAWMVTYNLAYESYWQDELASISAATGVLRTGLPVWSTGFLYAKAELYSYMLAAVIAVFGYNPIALRMVSAVEYMLALLAVFYVARYFFGRFTGLLAMALMLFSPFELHWGREARMYQQAQLLALVVVFLFYKAIEPHARTRYIYLSMAAMVALYLSHEETFIILPAFFIYFLWTQRLTWIRNRHWWIAGLSAIACVAAQLVVWRMSRRPILGTDRTVLFLLHYSPENVNFYLNLLFNPTAVGLANLDMFQVTMALSIVAALVGIVTRDRALRYFSVMAFLPLIALCISLPLVNDRYLYPLLPFLFILEAAMIARLLRALWRSARRAVSPRVATSVTVTVAALLCLIVIGSEIPSIGNMGLAVSRTFGLSYHHSHPDYEYAGNYIRAHWEPGDALITAAPEADAAFYAKQPTYYLFHSKALSLFQRHGQVMTNNTGAIPILNVNDLYQALSTYHRVWLLTATGHTELVGNSGPRPILYNFTLVYEGQNISVYLYTS
ncbi:MAG TPA: glycosyltransferase family 39 protein [Ktedonobacterales bacterium]